MKYILFGDAGILRKFISKIPLLRRVLNKVGWYDTHAKLADK